MLPIKKRWDSGIKIVFAVIKIDKILSNIIKTFHDNLR